MRALLFCFSILSFMFFLACSGKKPVVAKIPESSSSQTGRQETTPELAVEETFESDPIEALVRNRLKDLPVRERGELLDAPTVLPPAPPMDEIADLNLYSVEVAPGLEELVSQDVLRSRYDFPIVINKAVLAALDYFQGKGRPAVQLGLERSGRFLDLFQTIFASEGVPRDLVYMAQVESLWNPKALSRARAKGLWQFTSATAKDYGLTMNWWLDERSEVVKSTRAAARYLRYLHETYGDWYLALAAYNWGPGHVSRVLQRYGDVDYWNLSERHAMPRETRNFVPSILASIIIHRNPELYGFHFQPAPAEDFEAIRPGFQVDLRIVSEVGNIPLETLRRLNPELRYDITPYQMSDYHLKIPAGRSEGLVEKLSALPPEKRVQMRHHQVRGGETLSAIARRYGSSVETIAEVNKIRNIHRLRIGQNLMIPVGGDFRVGASDEVYRVRRGDSLYRIARTYGVKVRDLLRWNDLSPGAVIHPGQALRVTSTN